MTCWFLMLGKIPSTKSSLVSWDRTHTKTYSLARSHVQVGTFNYEDQGRGWFSVSGGLQIKKWKTSSSPALVWVWIAGTARFKSLGSMQSSVGEIKGPVQGSLYITVVACSSFSGFLASSAGMFFMQQYKQEAVILISRVFPVFESAWANISWLERCTLKEHHTGSVNHICFSFPSKKMQTDCIFLILLQCLLGNHGKKEVQWCCHIWLQK